MKRSAFDLAPLTFKAFLVASTLFMSASIASAQQQTSRVERYASYSQFEQGRTALRAEGYRVIDVEVCLDSTPYGSWVAVYRRVPNDTAPSDADYVVQSGDWSQFHARINNLVAEGWRIDDLDARGGSRTPYVAVLNHAGGDQQFFAQAWPGFVAHYSAFQPTGLQLVDIDFGILNGQRLYFGVMRPGAEVQQLHRDSSWAAFLARWTAMTGGDWRLREIAFAENEFAGVYEHGAGEQAVDMFSDWTALSQRAVDLDGSGAGDTLMEDVECWRDADGAHYAAVWRAPRHATRPHPEANPTTERPPVTTSDQGGPSLGTLVILGDGVTLTQPANPPAAPRFLVRATTLYANDETGPDWPGSDEIYAVFDLRHPDRLADSIGFTAQTSLFGDFDTGERKSFNDTQNCLTSALQDAVGSHGRVSAWHCHPAGDTGPLQFTVRLYEEDSIEDDLIGERTVQWSREELLGSGLEVGGTSEESIRIGGYTLTWRVERVS